MRVVLLICLFAAAAAAQNMPKIEPGVSEELAKWRAVQYSNISYKLNLTLEKMSPVLRGTVEIRVTQAAYACAEPKCPPMAIILDWRKIAGHEKDSSVSNVSLNGVALSVKPLLTRGLPQPGAQVGWKDPAGSTIPVGDEVAEARTSARAIAGTQYEERDDHLIFHDGVRMGENVIKLDFTSPILTSGAGVTRYIDREDGSEYIYSLFVPSDASTAFPCFDQPHLKARFTLKAEVPEYWTMVSNSPDETLEALSRPPDEFDQYVAAKRSRELQNTRDPRDPSTYITGGQTYHVFAQTKPISTYVFAFAAGPFRQYVGGPGGVVSPANAQRSIFVRKSQLAKFQPHAAEVARLRDEGIKYLEQYFDYKFPFPKLDILLIPEFPFGGMEHAGAIFLREDRVIFPAEPTAGDYITRANVIFHETAHQWFGDTVTMKWFDDLWLKEGFAEFMAYKTMEKVMPQYNAWKVFYERNKQAAYLTDSTKGTTPIYQKIDNLSAAKSAYGNIVYRKAPSFLRQAEFYLGEQKFQTAVRAFLKKHEFGNAGWEDLVSEFEAASGKNLKEWANVWVKERGLPIFRIGKLQYYSAHGQVPEVNPASYSIAQRKSSSEAPSMDSLLWNEKTKVLIIHHDTRRQIEGLTLIPSTRRITADYFDSGGIETANDVDFIFPNYQDYGYGIFLLDDKSRDHVLKNIQNEKDPFLRSMMWGALWDSVREAELDPRVYVELVIKNLPTETDETTAASIVARVSTALNYYISYVGGNASRSERVQRGLSPKLDTLPTGRVSASNASLRTRFEDVLLDRLQHAPTAGQRITFYRAYVANATSAKGREVLKQMLASASPQRPADAVRAGSPRSDILRTKDKFDIVTRLIILGDPEGPKLLAGVEKTETSDDAKRYAYAARAAFGTAENKATFFSDFISNKDISESWIETAVIPFNSIRQSELTQPYLERALKELPNLKRTRKIFFINNWLAAWIGGQRDQQGLDIINKFLADNPTLDNDLRLKVLENMDLIERAVRIRSRR